MIRWGLAARGTLCGGVRGDPVLADLKALRKKINGAAEISEPPPTPNLEPQP